jgi:diguanylate cyclase (GGDEF)-like protein/PAS domain S-box-containing protein
MGPQVAANLAALIESTTDLIWSVDLALRLQTFNRAFQENIEKTFGVRLAPGMNSLDFLPPEKAESWAALYQRALTEGPFRCEYFLADGRTLDLVFNRIVCAGEVSGISVFGKDITERKMAESATQDAERRYRALFEGALEGIFQSTLEGQPLTANPAMARMLGYDSVEEYLAVIQDVGREVWANAGERAEFLRLLEECGAVRGYQCRFRRKDGSTLWVSLNCRQILAADGVTRVNEGFIEDITARKQAEMELRGSEELFRAITETSPLVIVLAAGEEDRIEYVNPTFTRLFGYTKEEIRAAADWFPLAYPEPAYQQWVMEEWRRKVERTFETNSAFEPIETIVCCKDGSKKLIQWGFLMLGGRSLTFGLDLTGRKETERRLAESEELFRSITEASPLAIVLYSRELRNLYVNPAHTRLFGYTVQDFPTVDDWWPLAYPDLEYRARIMQEWRLRVGRAIETHSPIEPLDTEVTCKDGTKRNISWGFVSLGERNLAFGIDLSARVQAEKQMRESDAAYRATFDQAGVGIVYCSFEGVYLRSNARFAEIIGYPVEEVPGLAMAQVTPPEEYGQSAAVLHRMSSPKSETVHWEKRYLRKDGSLIWAKLTTSVQCDSEGRPLHQITFVEDIQARKEAEERLAEAIEVLRVSDERYHAAFKTSLDTICVTRLDDGMIVDVNDTFVDVLGYSREELIEQSVEVPNTWVDDEGEVHQDTFLDMAGRTTLEIDLWADKEDRRRCVEILRRDGVCRNFETRFRKKNGRIFWARLSASVTERDGVLCALAVIRDITESKAAEARLAATADALRRSEARYRTVFEASFDAISVVRREDGVFFDSSPAFYQILGYTREELVGSASDANGGEVIAGDRLTPPVGRSALDIDLWVDPDDRRHLLENLRQSSVCRDFETRFKKKNGEIVWVRLSASLFELEGVSCILFIIRDITAAKEAEEKIQSLSFYDTLTNLPNRRLLLERLKKALVASIQSTRKKALLHVDLDHFKILNDTLGHPIGDLILQEVARRLRACIHEEDTVARIGGDEFLLILEELSDVAEEAAAGAISERILSQIDQPFILGLLNCRCTASIGITVFGERLDSTDEVLQQADLAMGQAKAAGRNGIRFFSSSLQAAVNARAALEKDLRQAIGTSQLSLHYQPQVDGVRLIGAEALLRWQHPTLGMISPASFIPLAEETGLILPLGDWVLEAACRQMAAWTRDGLMAGATVGVNVSARQFHQSDFVAKTLKTLERTGIDPHLLKMELTESSLLENVEEVIAKMTELKGYGIQFSLDDFGTGYSSLSYLKRLPLNQLKIDISFVRDILTDASSGVIAQTIVALGRAMGLSVIAEGVETEAQREFLARLGCTSYQGYLFSRPLPKEDFARLLAGMNAVSR